MMTKMAIIPAILLVLACSSWGQTASSTGGRAFGFVGEEVALTVDDSTAQVSGTYFFQNYGGIDFRAPVFFPFYVDGHASYPDLIRAACRIGADTLRADLRYVESRRRGGISLSIPLRAHQRTTWFLSYQQKITSKRAVYMITSTHAWKEPLREATYTFVFPDYFKSVETWPPPDTAYSLNGKTFYRCTKRDFMPDREMEITWK